MKARFNFSQFRLTANWLDMARFLFIALVLTFAMYAFGNPYVPQWWLWVGYAQVLQILADWLDGPIAQWQERIYQLKLSPEDEAKLTFWQRLNVPGKTQLGMILDPLADKCGNGLTLTTGGYGFIQSYWIIVAIVAVDILLQFAVRPLKRWLGITEKGANFWGKAKTQIQGWTGSIMLFWRGWELPHADAIFTVPLLVALVFGVFSACEHLKPGFIWEIKRWFVRRLNVLRQ